MCRKQERKENVKVELISEEHYREQMEEKVEPELAKKRRWGYMRACHGTPDQKIYYEYYPLEDPRGNLVISHGFTETAEKYQELIYYFLKEGYQVFIMEHRGHGRSFREVEDVSLTHVEHFRFYVEDFSRFAKRVVLPASRNRPLYLFAHSMGGAVGAAVLERSPGLFERAVLSSPMMKVNMGRAPVWLAWLVAAACTAFGNGKRYAPGHRPYPGEGNFEKSSSTSRARFEYYEEKKKKTPWMQNHGASCRWAVEGLAGAARVRSRRGSRRVSCPVLVLQAEQDAFVADRGEVLFGRRVPEGKCVRFPKTRHELYRSDNETLRKYLETIFLFLEETKEAGKPAGT